MDMIIREWMRYQCKAYFEFELFYFDGEIFLQLVDQLIYFKVGEVCIIEMLMRSRSISCMCLVKTAPMGQC